MEKPVRRLRVRSSALLCCVLVFVWCVCPGSGRSLRRFYDSLESIRERTNRANWFLEKNIARTLVAGKGKLLEDSALKLLGQGGTGTVFRGFYSSENEDLDVAIKFIHLPGDFQRKLRMYDTAKDYLNRLIARLGDKEEEEEEVVIEKTIPELQRNSGFRSSQSSLLQAPKLDELNEAEEQAYKTFEAVEKLLKEEDKPDENVSKELKTALVKILEKFAPVLGDFWPSENDWTQIEQHDSLMDDPALDQLRNEVRVAFRMCDVSPDDTTNELIECFDGIGVTRIVAVVVSSDCSYWNPASWSILPLQQAPQYPYACSDSNPSQSTDTSWTFGKSKAQPRKDFANVIALVYEFCAGGSLDEVFNQWRNDVTEYTCEEDVNRIVSRSFAFENRWEPVVDTLTAVAYSLAHLHARGIVWRDAKPENILTCRKVTTGQSQLFTTRVKLHDMGLALLAVPNEAYVQRQKQKPPKVSNSTDSIAFTELIKTMGFSHFGGLGWHPQDFYVTGTHSYNPVHPLSSGGPSKSSHPPKSVQSPLTEYSHVYPSGYRHFLKSLSADTGSYLSFMSSSDSEKFAFTLESPPKYFEGTPVYMPPEVVPQASRPFDYDTFGFGQMIFEALAEHAWPFRFNPWTNQNEWSFVNVPSFVDKNLKVCGEVAEVVRCVFPRRDPGLTPPKFKMHKKWTFDEDVKLVTIDRQEMMAWFSFLLPRITACKLCPPEERAERLSMHPLPIDVTRFRFSELEKMRWIAALDLDLGKHAGPGVPNSEVCRIRSATAALILSKMHVCPLLLFPPLVVHERALWTGPSSLLFSHGKRPMWVIVDGIQKTFDFFTLASDIEHEVSFKESGVTSESITDRESLSLMNAEVKDVGKGCFTIKSFVHPTSRTLLKTPRVEEFCLNNKERTTSYKRTYIAHLQEFVGCIAPRYFPPHDSAPYNPLEDDEAFAAIQKTLESAKERWEEEAHVQSVVPRRVHK